MSTATSGASTKVYVVGAAAGWFAAVISLVGSLALLATTGRYPRWPALLAAACLLCPRRTERAGV